MPSTVSDDNKPVRGRTRRTSAEARRAALDAAHALLREQGPAALTLKAVAVAVGMTHGNVTHHFGTSAALRMALVARMAERLSAEAEGAVVRLRRGELAAEAIADLVFATFEQGGYGRLIAWLATTGQDAQLAPIFEALRTSVRGFRAGEPAANAGDERGAGPIVLGLLSHALAASLIGAELEGAAGMPAGSLRRIAAGQVRSLRATPAAQPKP